MIQKSNNKNKLRMCAVFSSKCAVFSSKCAVFSSKRVTQCQNLGAKPTKVGIDYRDT